MAAGIVVVFSSALADNLCARCNEGSDHAETSGRRASVRAAGRTPVSSPMVGGDRLSQRMWSKGWRVGARRGGRMDYGYQCAMGSNATQRSVGMMLVEAIAEQKDGKRTRV